LGWVVVDPEPPAPSDDPPVASISSPADPPAVDLTDGPATGSPVTPTIPEASVGPTSGPIGAPLAAQTGSRLGVIDGWWATLAAAPLPDTLLGDGDLAAEALDLTHAHPSGLATLMAGRPTRLSSLVREPAAHAAARRRARVIRTAVQQLASERGVRAGYLALGLVSWWAGDGGSDRRGGCPGAPLRAPLLLRGCDLHPRGAGHEDYELYLDPAVGVNPEVLRRLREDHGIRLDGEALCGLAFGPDGFDPRPVFAHLEDVCRGVPGFAIDPRLVVGSFTAGSGALLGDLDTSAPALRVHPVLSQLVYGSWPPPTRDRPASSASWSGETATRAGETATRAGETANRSGETASWSGEAESIGRPYVATDDPPDPLLSVLPLDPAQRRTVRAIRDGDSLALQGPSGTGVTQATAAAVVALAGSRQRVLVVTPNRSTARNLISRIADCGLRELVLDLHDGFGDQSGIRAGLAQQLDDAVTGAGLDRAERAVRVTGDGDVSAVVAATAVLTGASAALHAVRGPWGVSAYDAMEALAALMATDVAPRTRVRLSAEVCQRLDAVEREKLRADLHAAAEAGAFTLTRVDTRWLDAAVRTQQDVERALSAAVTAREGLPVATALMNAVAEAAGLTPAQTVADWRPLLELLLGVRDTLDVMLPAVYEQPITDLITAIDPDPGSRGAGTTPGLFARRALRRRARALVRPGVHVEDVHARLAAAADQRRSWQQFAAGGGWPRVPTGLADAERSVREVETALSTLAGYLAGTHTPDLSGLPLDQLGRRLGDLAQDGGALAAQPERTRLLERLRAAGLRELIDDLRDRRCLAEDVDGELDLAWWTSVLEAIVRSDPRLAHHDPAQQAAALEELRGSAERLAAAGVAQIRRAVAVRAREVVAAHPEQVKWLQAEVHRGHRSQWPADLFRRAGDVIAALRPVLVMSPDAVARSLPAAVAGHPLIDVGVIDDAGQVGMPEAAAALARCGRIVVAGNAHGLPPASGRPSALEALGARLPVHVLDRDHRTRDGRLLAPVRRGHPGVWAVTPGAAPAAPLELEHVWESVEQREAAAASGDAAGTDAEVRRVVDLVAEHAARRPGESLIVVTLGPRHAERIEEALRAEVTSRPDLARWLEVHWTGKISESFMVRPVHRLAGVERDAAIVSIGLGRTAHGRVLHRFGVLDGSFGRACLTVALTRARRRITLVSSFTAGDLDRDRLRSDGARMLWDVLALAADPVLRGDHGIATDAVHGGAAHGDAAHGDAAHGDAGPVGDVDPLVADLRDRLLAVGLPVRPGVDAPDWPLSLVVADPLVPGHLLLAVDVDGEHHAACPSVAVRDALRREAFERAGWTYVRVAAMDLFCDPAGEVERVRRAWRAAGGRTAGETPSTGLIIVGRPKVRATWPGVPVGRPIGEYSGDQLRQVASWVLTDGIQRGVEDLVAGVCEALQLVLRGPRVEALVSAAARVVLGAGTLES
jgi:hypothetical protein